jgi:flagellar protein FlaJ
MFGKKKQTIDVDGKSLELQPKPSTLSGMFKRSKKPMVHIAEVKPLITQPKKSALSGMFNRSKKPTVHIAEVKPLTAQPKTSAFSGIFAGSNKPAARTEQKQPPQAAQNAAYVAPKPAPQRIPGFAGAEAQKQTEGTEAQQKIAYAAKSEIKPIKKRGRLYLYIENVESKHKGLETSLREQGVRQNVHEFIQRMLIASVMLAVVLAITLSFLFFNVGLPLLNSLIFGLVIGVASYYVAFGEFVNYPTRRAKAASKNIERDILSAARDMIISLRSGMPLFNAIVAISTGYADASKEFAKVIERVQLGLPLEDAIDQTTSETKSASFKRMMLQASTSIKAGADVIDALQSVIDQLSQERIIELRRYGQKLNAIAMFYMLFGIILPSMGIAVLVILTTFIAIFTVTTSVLAFVVVGMVFLQLIFLQLIIGSRPVYSM